MGLSADEEQQHALTRAGDAAAGVFIASQVARAANVAAVDHIFEDYHLRIDADTYRRQEADLALFAHFLAEIEALPRRDAAVFGARLLHEAAAWANVGWGLVSTFLQWQLQEGYAIGSINVRLATVKRYAGMAQAAGVISAEDIALIRTVRGYSGKQARAIDRQRAARRLPTRVGEKKARPLILAEPQIRALKQQPATPQGRRDMVLICLLADHGLRVGELAALEVSSIDLAGASFSFYREKVHKTQTHRLSRDALAALQAYMAGDAPAQGRLLRGSRKNGELWGLLSERAIRERVRLLGERIGLVNLAPHDLRHTWATRAAARSDPFALRDAGGWNSLQMPNRYAEQSAIANERIDLGDEN